MEIPVRVQLMQAALGLLTGGAMGLAWDIIRLFRRRLPRLAGEAVGVLCLLACAVFAFLSGQESGAGMGVFFLCVCGVGWALYLWGLEDAAEAVLERLTFYVAKMFEKMRNNTKMPLNFKKIVGFFRKKHLCKK